MSKTFAELGNEVDALDEQIAMSRAHAEKLPQLEEERAKLVSEMNRKLGGLPEDPADGEDDAGTLRTQEKGFEEKGHDEQAQGNQAHNVAPEIKTVDADGLVPEQVAKDLGLADLRKAADGGMRFDQFKL